MKEFLILFSLFFVGVNLAFAAAPLPPTYFQSSLQDSTGQLIETPAFLVIKEIHEGELIDSYTIDLFENPQQKNVFWFPPFIAENTEIHISAGKLRYQLSDEFVFTVTSQTPKRGLLFEHTFVLHEQIEMVGRVFDITSAGSNYYIKTKSSSEINSVFFDDDEQSLIISLSEGSTFGATILVISNDLFQNKKSLVLDGSTIVPDVEIRSEDFVLTIEYEKGPHTIEIFSISETTEFTKPTQPEEIPTSTGQGGGCLIATAAFGSELAPQVQQLREIRDNTLLKTSSGTSFMDGFNSFYYSFSPTIADLERENPAFKELVKTTITPMIATLSILNHVDIDSEEEMLGYGIGIILMNVGMYFVAPAAAIFVIRRKFF